MHKIPENSILKSSDISFDYVDSYKKSFLDETDKVDISKIGKLFFASKRPRWIEVLLSLRNRIVVFWGLKTSKDKTDRQKECENFNCEKGEEINLFKVFDKTENELILGQDDKHLNFRVSLLLDKSTDKTKRKDLTITTVVQFNNLFGRLYFLSVSPFHRLIVPTMLNAILNKIEKNKLL